MRIDRSHDALNESAPFSRLLAVDNVPDEGADIDIAATPAECEAVAAQIKLPAIATIAARLHIARYPGGRIAVTGEVRARLTQMCVVSLEPFESETVQPVEINFAPAKSTVSERLGESANAAASHRRRVVQPDPLPLPSSFDEEDPPDPIINRRIDLGAVAVEYLTLGLDIYPKKPGVQFQETVIGDSDEAPQSAFAALERLKDRS